MIYALILYAVSVFIASVSQIILKKGADQKHSRLIFEYLNAYVISGYMLFLISAIMTMIAYKTVPVSVGPVVESLGYIFILFLSSLFLKEKITVRKLIGNAVIMAGIIIIAA